MNFADKNLTKPLETVADIFNVLADEPEKIENGIKGIMPQLESPTYRQAQNYWALYEKLEASIDQSDPAVYRAIRNMRIAVSAELAARSLDTELTRRISTPVPLLYLALHLGCGNETLRTLNRPEDSFVMKGDVRYV
jgi:hypothetical protein